MEQFLNGIDPIDLAWALLGQVRNYSFSGTTPRQQPYQLLSAMLTYALTPGEIADDIIAAAMSTNHDIYINLQNLTNYYFNMFVMGIISLGFWLTVVRRGGGRTPAMSEHPSRIDTFQQNLVNRRLTEVEKVFHPC